MSDQTRVSHPIYNLLPTEIEGFDSLAELALDVHWSWNHATDGLWRTLDPVLWDLTQNPWVVLQTVSRDQLERVLADPAFRNRRPRDQRSPRATWDSVLSDDLWTEACGKERWLGTTENLEQDIRRVSDTTLWKFRAAASKSLVEYARGRLCRQLTVSGASHEAIDGAKHLFDPNALTPGILPQWTYLRAR